MQEHKVTISDSVVTCGNTINFEAHTNNEGTGTEDIRWLGDSGEHSGKTFTLSPQQPGVLTVEAGTSTGCAADASVTVSVLPAVASAEITNISANLDNKNQINWVYHNPDEIDSVLILGKTDDPLKDYDTLARLLKSDLENHYLDTRDPKLLGQTLYTMATKDFCGLLTTMEIPPGEHRALQLNASTPDAKNWMLQWGNYKGRTVQQFTLYKGSSPENLSPIYTTASNNSYFDISSLNDTVFYRVKAVFLDKYPEEAQNKTYSNLFLAKPVDKPFSDTVKIYDTIYTVTDTLVIDVPFVGIDNLTDAGRVKIYPNPTNDLISIETTGISTPEKYTIKISSLSGYVVYIRTLSGDNEQLNPAEFGAGGLYFVELRDDKGARIARRKIVLE